MQSRRHFGKGRFVLSALALAVSANAANADIIFSEYVEGSGYNKAIELYNTGTEQVDLSNYTVRLHTNGAADNIKSLTLSDKSLDAGKVLVIAHSSASDEIKAKANIINASITNFNGNDPLVLLQGDTPVDAIGVIGNSSDFAKDKTLSRKEGIKTGSTAFAMADWEVYGKDDINGLGLAPGDRNGSGGGGDTGPDFGSCGDTNALRISAIQGTGDVSPVSGNSVLVQGVVTQVTTSGYYIQQAHNDADLEGASLGLYVYDNINNKKLSVGDEIYLKGKVSEYKQMTQLSGIKTDEIKTCTSGNPIPDPVVMSMPLSNMEQYEGMRVHIKPEAGDEGFYVTDSYSFSRYGQLGLASGNGPLVIPTDKAIPGSKTADDIKKDNATNRLILEDGFSGQNPDVITYYPKFSHQDTVRIGNRVEGDLIGSLHQFDNNYQLVPVEAISIDSSKNGRLDQPEAVPADALRVASFNVLNYFNGYAGEDGSLTPDDAKYWEKSQNGNARGANNKAEFATQREKIITAISRMNADIIGILEMENDGWDKNSAIYDLVDNGLNKVSDKTYSYVKTSDTFIGGDVIKVSLIYNKDAVEPVGEPTILTAYPFDKQTAKHRPSMIQTFKEKASGKEITVAINHFKSKGSSCETMADPTDLFGQGNCNRMRVTAAETLGKHLAENHKGEDILLLGDLNAYGKEDPVLIMTNEDKGSRATEKLVRDDEGNYTAKVTDYRMDFINLGPKHIKEDYFSYSFGGEVGSLDHALSSPSLDKKVVQVQDWNINAAEPTGLDYNTEYKSEAVQDKLIDATSPFRSSDHNPIIVDVKLKENSGTNTGDDDDSGSMGWFTLGLGLLGLAGRRRKKNAA